MSASLLEKYTAIALSRGKSFLSKEEELRDVLLWQNQRDEKALERLIIDKALLVWSKTRDLRLAFTPIVSASDTDQWAVEGIQKGVEAYPADKPDASLNTYVLNAARWNILHEVRPYFRSDKKHEYGASRFKHADSAHAFADDAEASDLDPDTDLGYVEESELQNAFNEGIDRFPGAVFPDPYEALETKRLREDVSAVLDTLPRTQRNFIRLRYGLGIADRFTAVESKPKEAFMSHEEIGQIFGLTRDKVRELEGKTFRLLKNPFRKGKLAAYAEEGVPSPELGFDGEEPEETVFNPFEGLFDAADGPAPDVG